MIPEGYYITSWNYMRGICITPIGVAFHVAKGVGDREIPEQVSKRFTLSNKDVFHDAEDNIMTITYSITEKPEVTLEAAVERFSKLPQDFDGIDCAKRYPDLAKRLIEMENIVKEYEHRIQRRRPAVIPREKIQIGQLVALVQEIAPHKDIEASVKDAYKDGCDDIYVLKMVTNSLADWLNYGN